jgi:hypothetical protein
MTQPGIDEATLDAWERVIEDMEATAAEYEADGWDAIELHPGDVTALPPEHDRFGLDVLVPGSEYERVNDAVDTDDGAFDSFEVFRATTGGQVYLTVAVKDERQRIVVLVPAYYEIKPAKDTLAGVDAQGRFPIHVRPLSLEGVVTVEPTDPDLLLPPEH